MSSIYARRKSLRLKNYDYSLGGYYFVTLCTIGRECLFGDIIDFKMTLSDHGMIVTNTWLEMPTNYQMLTLDEWCLMPNHMHALVHMDDTIARKPLGSLIGAFKTKSTTRVQNQISPGVRLWQLDFFERIVRTERALERIREYIQNNPVQWQLDCENPSNFARRTITDELQEIFELDAIGPGTAAAGKPPLPKRG